MSVSSLLSSFFSVIHADAPEEKSQQKEEPAQEAQEEQEEQEVQEEPQAEAEEEEEPEDVLPSLQDECQESAKCAPLTKHFAHCEEKVNAGEGFKGEDCVEEFYHMMHCVNGCVAPKLFSKLQ